MDSEFQQLLKSVERIRNPIDDMPGFALLRSGPTIICKCYSSGQAEKLWALLEAIGGDVDNEA